jgi:hypothetical protein
LYLWVKASLELDLNFAVTAHPRHQINPLINNNQYKTFNQNQQTTRHPVKRIFGEKQAFQHKCETFRQQASVLSEKTEKNCFQQSTTIRLQT